MFKVPTFVVKDPELIHQIMIKDFGHFYDRGFPAIKRDVLFSENLFNLRGQSWRSLRNKLTPTFTSGKIKHMFDQFLKSGDHMLESINQPSEKTFDAKLVSLEFGTEVIASTAFGIDFSKDNPQTKEFVKNASSGTFQGLRLNLTLFLATVVPKTVELLRISMFKPGTMDYFINLTKATKEYRKEKNVKRNDYFDLLMTLQEAEKSGKSSGLPPVVDGNEEDAVINQMEYAPEDTVHDKVAVEGKLDRTDKLIFWFLEISCRRISFFSCKEYNILYPYFNIFQGEGGTLDPPQDNPVSATIHLKDISCYTFW